MSTVSITRPDRSVGARARVFDPGMAAGWLVLLAALAISIGPFLYLISMSLMDNPQLFGGKIVASPARWANYPEAWVVTKIGMLYWNSLYISGVSMAVTVAIS